MKSGRAMDEGVVKKIKTSIRTARSARHVPSKILQVSDVPVTLTGKKVEGEFSVRLVAISLALQLSWYSARGHELTLTVPIRKVRVTD